LEQELLLMLLSELEQELLSERRLFAQMVAWDQVLA
jgi:hypothetical protein